MKDIKKIAVLLLVASCHLRCMDLTTSLEQLRSSLNELLTQLSTPIPIPTPRPIATTGWTMTWPRVEPYDRGPITIHLLKGNLINTTNLDAIVNPANPAMEHGGLLSGAIFDAADKKGKGAHLTKIINERKRAGTLPPKLATSQAVILPALDLQTNNNIGHIIFTVGPHFGKADANMKQLEDAYYNTLIAANHAGFQTIGFPLISAGVYRAGQSRDRLAQATFDGIFHYADTVPFDNSITDIYVICYKQAEFDTYSRVFKDMIRL